MDITITPSPLSGKISAISSKSDAHRLLICAGLCAGETTRIHITDTSKDIDATAGVLRSMGAAISREGEYFLVASPEKFNLSPLCNCGESGSTLRFLLPVVAAACGSGSFSGSGKLPERPIVELIRAMASHGVSFSSDRLPFSISGAMSGGEFSIPGNISSQYISGILLSLPLSDGGAVQLTTKLESASYVDMTLSTMGSFGIDVGKSENGWFVPAGLRYKSPRHISAEGDWSNGAFFLAAGAIGGDVQVSGLSDTSLQGDMKIMSILSSFGAHVVSDRGLVSVKQSSLNSLEIDISNIPDLLPILAVTAAFASGETYFYGGARLRLKESDRLSATSSMLSSLGGHCLELPDGLVVSGGGLSGGVVNGFNDHRIVMSAAIAGAFCQSPVTILGAQAVEKSYPEFFRDFRELGGIANVI